MSVLSYDFMQRALLAAVLVGLAAPAVGTYLVQRRLALIGDGIGHVALTGVALGLLLGNAPILVALVTAIAGAVAIEVVRLSGKTSGDLALAIMFYGGIAGGVVLISKAPGGSAASLNQYLFGAITTTSAQDLLVFGALSIVVLVLAIGLMRPLFAISYDSDYATATGLPVLALNVLLAVMTATTVVVAMRVVGLLLISALMVVPVATAQLLAHSFRATFFVSLAIGVSCAATGVVASYYLDTPSGGTIVLMTIAVFIVVAVGAALVRLLLRRRPATVHA